jgi:hypothetical protein
LERFSEGRRVAEGERRGRSEESGFFLKLSFGRQGLLVRFKWRYEQKTRTRFFVQFFFCIRERSELARSRGPPNSYDIERDRETREAGSFEAGIGKTPVERERERKRERVWSQWSFFLTSAVAPVVLNHSLLALSLLYSPVLP